MSPVLHLIHCFPTATYEEVATSDTPSQRVGIIRILYSSPAPASASFAGAARRHWYWGYSGCPRIIVYVPVEGIVQSFSFSSSYYPRASTADTYSSSSYGRLSLPPLLPLRLPLLLPGPLLTGGTISGRPIEAIVQ